ncbi:MAG: hypothetical protein HC913_08770 [Microscillaceae bacterium]|nr:hypothetical protein [Microscillaceae bacterium]
MINPDFWQNALDNDGFKVGAIKHEILHILFKHIFRHKDFSHKLIFNIAADLVVNQYIKSVHLIPGAVHLEDFPELNLKPHQPLNAYYNALMELYQSRQNAPGKGQGNTETSQAWENLRKLLDQNDPNHQKHAFWQKIEELSSAERDILESVINQAIQNTLQNTKNEEMGYLPAALQRYLMELERSLVPIINWRRVLRLFSNSSSATRLQNTIRRPSKRYGTTPGIKVKKKQKVLVALDTSGSIQTEELVHFFSGNQPYLETRL